MRHHCFLATQNDKKKFDRKKQLWEQYKNILAEKMAKKKAEAKETHREVTIIFNLNRTYSLPFRNKRL